MAGRAAVSLEQETDFVSEVLKFGHLFDDGIMNKVLVLHRFAFHPVPRTAAHSTPFSDELANEYLQYG